MISSARAPGMRTSLALVRLSGRVWRRAVVAACILWMAAVPFANAAGWPSPSAAAKMCQAAREATAPQTMPDEAELRLMRRLTAPGASRAPAFQSLQRRMTRHADPLQQVDADDLTVRPERAQKGSAEAIRLERSLQSTSDRLHRDVEASLWLWRLTSEAHWLQRALQSVAWFAAADINVTRADVAAGRALTALVMAIDWVPATAWPDGARAQAMQAANKLYAAMVDHVVTGPRSLRVRLESHRSALLPRLAVAALVLQRWQSAETLGMCTDVLAHFLREPWPWGGADGGFAGGTAYASWHVLASVSSWDRFRRATGVDPIRDAPGLSSFGEFARYTMRVAEEPGSKFGDAAERDIGEARASMIRAYAARRGLPELVRFASFFTRHDRTRIELLTAPVDIPEAAVAQGGDSLESVKVFDAVGVASLRNGDEPDAGFVAYLRSSPYGGLSHGHADQNAVLLYLNGQPVLRPSGVYDAYASAHHLGWTRRTVAHNALTFDGGIGQTRGEVRGGSQDANGRIAAHGLAHGVAWAVGDATPAYDGDVSHYRRWVVRFDEGAVVLLDSVEAPRPRRWELNFHTSTPARPARAERALAFRVGGGDEVCISSATQGDQVAWRLNVPYTGPQPRGQGDFVLPRHQIAEVTTPVKRFLHATLIEQGNCASAHKLRVTFEPDGATLTSAKAQVRIRTGSAAVDVVKR